MLDGQNADGTVTTPDAAAQGQNAAPAWTAQLPDDLKGNETFTGYKTIGDLAKDTLSLKEKATALEGKLTTDYIPKLTDNATDEQKVAYRAAMGIPDKPEGYEVDLVDGQATELANVFKNWAHKYQLPKEAAKGISQEFNKFVAQITQAQQEGALKAVKDKWGADFDKNAETVKGVFKALEADGFNDLAQLQVVGADGKPMSLGNHPVAMQFFLEFGKKMLPDSGIGGAGAGDARTLDEKAKDFYKT